MVNLETFIQDQGKRVARWAHADLDGQDAR